MVKVSSQQLKSGMVVAKPIVTKHGQSIAKAQTELDAQMIARIAFYRIPTVYVTKESYEKCTGFVDYDPSADQIFKKPTAEVVPEILDGEDDLVTPEQVALENPDEAPPQEPDLSSITEAQPKRTYTQKLMASPAFQAFQTAYSRNMVNLRDCFDRIVDGSVTTDDLDRLIRQTSDMFASKTSLELFDMVHTVRSVDDATYAHCLNVALISRAIGKWLHFSRKELDALTLAGLLHDIGKTQLPDGLLTKHGQLTEEELTLLRNHAQDGYRLLKPLTFLDNRVKLTALQHHERYDGSGYPGRLRGDDIDDFAAIVAIADVYDSMTAARTYRVPQCAFQVIAAFEDDGFQKYNPRVIYVFLRRVASCYINSRVILNNGVSGYVVFLHSRQLSRPVIQTDDETVIDLGARENKDLFIKSIL
jgi:putative nucleotidyltransferase with HDIG domain